MKFAGLKVGDQVAVRNHPGTKLWLVTKVGRKYFEAGGCEFHRIDGRSTSGYSDPHAFTMPEYEMAKRVAAAKKKLEAFGVKLEWGTKDDKVLLVLEALQPHMALDSGSGGNHG